MSKTPDNFAMELIGTNSYPAELAAFAIPLTRLYNDDIKRKRLWLRMKTGTVTALWLTPTLAATIEALAVTHEMPLI